MEYILVSNKKFLKIHIVNLCILSVFFFVGLFRFLNNLEGRLYCGLTILNYTIFYFADCFCIKALFQNQIENKTKVVLASFLSGFLGVVFLYFYRAFHLGLQLSLILFVLGRPFLFMLITNKNILSAKLPGRFFGVLGMTILELAFGSIFIFLTTLALFSMGF